MEIAGSRRPLQSRCSRLLGASITAPHRRRDVLRAVGLLSAFGDGGKLQRRVLLDVMAEMIGEGAQPGVEVELQFKKGRVM